MIKNLSVTFFVLVLFSAPAFAQRKKRTAATAKLPASTPASGVIKTVKSGKNLIKFVKFDAATNSVTVSGTTLDWEKEGNVYFNISAKKGQHLTITPSPDNTAIELFMDFSPLDATTSGSYEHNVTKTWDYQIVARTPKIGEKYTLTFKLK